MALTIHTIENDPKLRTKSADLSLEKLASDKIQTLIDKMIPKMYDADGIGLAAPQIGEHIRLAVVGLTKDEQIVLINPEITFFGKRTQVMDEGCLSIPNTTAPVERPDKIRVKALDRHGNQFKMKAKGLLARVIQHEIDHLDGVLFIDRVDDKTMIRETASESPL